jgi:hypothetical protein
MSMTKTDYELIARTLKENEPPIDWGYEDDTIKVAHEYWQTCVEQFSRDLEQDNPRFSKTKFLQACGIEQEQAK